MIAMMGTLLVLTPRMFLYAFPEKTLHYDIQVEFEGNVPVSLFQGSEQKVKVEWSLSVTKKEPPEPDLVALTFQVTDFALSLWDPEGGSYVKMPFGLESVREFFPDAEVYVTQNGAVKRTTAPRLEFPVRLPGLDSQHIPDVTFLLLEFPQDPIEKGSTWSFTRPIPEAPLECTATYQGEEGGKERFGLTVHQKYVTLEDGNYNVVGKKEDARVRVESEMRGTGVVEFSGERGIVTRGEWQGEAVSRVVSLDGRDRPPTRSLRIKSIISLRPEKDKNTGGEEKC
jgi:hypothetical protein